MADFRRLELQRELEELMNGDGQVYYLPDNNVHLSYPCLVYEVSNEDYFYSGNVIYISRKQYDLTLIARDPECDIADRIVTHGFFRLRFDRKYHVDGLYHTVYKLYY